MILVQLREHGGDFALAVGVVERVVDGRRRDAQARGGIAIEDHAHAQAVHLLIGGHVAQLGYFLQARHHLRNEGVQLVGVGIFERVLVLRAADAIFHGQILHRLHIQRDARDLGQLRLQSPDHVAGADLPLLERLQVDLNASRVQRGVGSIDADERRQALDRRILQNHFIQRLLPLRHGPERDGLLGFGNALNHARILNREESFRNLDEQDKREEPTSPAATSNVSG